MRILKAGTPQKTEQEKLYLGTCQKCGCVVECVQEDCSWQGSWNLKSQTAPYLVVACPTTKCSYKIPVEPKPGEVAIREREKYCANAVWKNPERRLCKINEEGKVTFAADITGDELRLAVTLLLQQREAERSRRMENWDKGIRDLGLSDMVYLSEQMGEYDTNKIES